MKRIFFIVLWVFVLFFTAEIASIICAIGLDAARLKSWSDFLMDKLLRFILYAAPIIAVILGLFGHLPGTKEPKSIQLGTKTERPWGIKVIEYLILRIGLFFFFALATLPVAAMAIWAAGDFESQNETIPIVPVAFYYFGLIWFSNRDIPVISWLPKRRHLADP